MNDISLGVAFGLLLLLLLCSAFFSSSETAMMALNRYRLKHMADQGHRGAMQAQRLLQEPDRLIGVILLGNNFVNIFASSVVTLVALRWGDLGIAIAPIVLTLLILIFAEVLPKTLAVLHSERISFAVATPLRGLQVLLHPAVRGVNIISNGIIGLLRLLPTDPGEDYLSRDELRTVVSQSGGQIRRSHQTMLLRILDMEAISVEDRMVPRAEIEAIDLDDDWNLVVEQLTTSPHTRVPVCQGGLDNIVGIIHLRTIARILGHDEFDREALVKHMSEPYFVPESTPLTTQLLNFQKTAQRIAVVVDEYGQTRGVITTDDVLEEIVGELNLQPQTNQLADIHPQKDGSFLVDGSVNLRELNRTMNWTFPVDGPKTLNGLLLEYLEDIPTPGTGVKLADHPVEVVQIADNQIKRVRIYPALVDPNSDNSSESSDG
ncbi:MAG: HlyC/CorC family transporter [Gammaproteobacteria bacterium]|nr:HlyC/CorC family transporter [Gammaproteobacteria bacterium]